MNDRVPDLLVEQLALDELSPADAEQVRSRLGSEADPRVAELQRSNASVLEEHPPEQIAHRIQQRLGQLDAREASTERANPWRGWMLSGAVAVAAAGVLAWVLSSSEEITPPSEQDDVIAIATPPQDTVRLKGDAAIVLRKRVGSGSELLAPGDSISPGDELLVSYRAAGEKYGVLVSLDGAGEVTLHFPETREDSTGLKPAGAIALHSFELDDAPHFERFFFVTGAAEVDVGRVLQRARNLGASADAGTAALRFEDASLAIVEFPLKRVAAP